MPRALACSSLLCALGALGCSASIADGVFECAADSDCPPAMGCRADGFCYAGEGRDGGPVDAGPDAGCVPGTETCDGADQDCDGVVDEGFDLSSDLGHCGACDNVCPAVAFGTRGCVAGSCTVASCDAGRADCDGDVADGCEADLCAPESCGGCGVECSAGTQFCVRGADGCACGAACGSGETNCDGACANLMTSSAHCGGCGRACDDGELCEGGRCQCGAGGADCDAPASICCEPGCVDPMRDPQHCGGCGISCDDGNPCTQDSCAAGSCINSAAIDGTTCAGGLCCGGACVDTFTDPANCGVCGMLCRRPNACQEAFCNSGVCALRDAADGTQCHATDRDFRCCSGSCRNTDTDIEHCGGCRLGCSASDSGASCTDGRCQCFGGAAAGCPNTNFFCNASSRCVCQNAAACAPGQACGRPPSGGADRCMYP